MVIKNSLQCKIWIIEDINSNHRPLPDGGAVGHLLGLTRNVLKDEVLKASSQGATLQNNGRLMT